MEEIEGTVDDMHAALAIDRRLGMGEGRQSGIVDPAEFAVDIGALHVHIGERRDGAWVSIRPVEPGPGQELHAAVVYPRRHAKAVELDLVNPLRP
jgi:hypothetical protein